MADYCKQCSIGLFGEDCKDLAGITNVKDTRKGLYANVVCEGCGWTLVDHTGECVLHERGECDPHPSTLVGDTE